jgi:hypothetical protein
MENNDDYKLIKEEIIYETDENGNNNKVIMKYFEKKHKFYENMKKSVSEYQKKNKESVSKRISARQVERYNTDPEYKEKIKEQQKQYYLRKKQLKNEST